MLAMSGTMVLPSLIFQVFNGCQTYVQAKEMPAMELRLISSFFTFMGFFSPSPNPQDPNIIIFNFDFLYVFIELEYVILYFKCSTCFH